MISARGHLKTATVLLCLIALIVTGTSWGVEHHHHRTTKKKAVKTAVVKKKTKKTKAQAVAPPAPVSKEIKIGVCLPLSGPDSLGGLSQKNAILSAHAVQPAAGKKVIHLMVRDTQGTASGAAQAARSLITSDKVDGLIGGATTAEARALIHATQTMRKRGAKKPALIITTAAGALSTGKGSMVHICSPLSAQGKSGAAFAVQKLKARRASIILNTENPDAITLAGAFSSQFINLGGSILDIITSKKELAGSSAHMALLSRKPDIIFLPYSGATAHFIRQLRSQNIQIPILVANIIHEKIFFEQLKHTNGIYLISDFSPERISSGRALNCLRTYQRSYGRMDSQAALAADAYFFFADRVAGILSRPKSPCGHDYLTGAMCLDSDARISRAIYLRAIRETGVNTAGTLRTP